MRVYPAKGELDFLISTKGSNLGNRGNPQGKGNLKAIVVISRTRIQKKDNEKLRSSHEGGKAMG